jgi:hypothetical protein
MTKITVTTEDYLLIKDIIRMIVRGNGLMAIMHIYANFRGMPVVDFVKLMLTIAQREFIIVDSFYSTLSKSKDFDTLRWYIEFWSNAFSSDGERWS